ncbi:hypothetical protein CFC21_097476 [Triticum aestivum]|uniref:HECT-type E3 ubiquitin transferase n=2 Tax=Triticum aestivum TaxID=4565 RepID=A0A3B6RHQ7_WHEAT|nr:E3 ubiquitin-protein ligase UPL5-like [Triticum aestivum]KAF7095271.1 hypothetical protein CFC21_097476 [Triticum aestivum]
MDPNVVAISQESNSSSDAIRLTVQSIDGKKTVVVAGPQDTLGEVLGRFVDVGPRRRSDLHAVHECRNLHLEAKINELDLPRGATLHLTRYPDAWSLASQIAAAATTDMDVSNETAELFKRFIHDGEVQIDPLARHLGVPNCSSWTDFEHVTKMLYTRDIVLLVKKFLASAKATNERQAGTAVEYLDVLLRSGVIGVLVRLYSSGSMLHHLRANSAIICLLYPEISGILPRLEVCFLPLWLELCRLIPAASGKGRSDPLYEKCRHRLAAVLSLFERTPSLRMPKMPQEWLIERLIPIAKDATDVIIRYMAAGWAAPDDKLFVFRVLFALVCYFRRREVYAQRKDGPVGAVLSRTAMSLLISVNAFMTRLEGASPSKEQQQQDATHNILPGLATLEQHQQDTVDSIWVVLGQLDMWSVTDCHLAGAIRATCTAHAACLNALVLGTSADRSRCKDIGRIVVKHKDLLGFEVRMHFARAMLPEMDATSSVFMLFDDEPHALEMLIDRSQLLPDSFRYVSEAASHVLHGRLFVEFLDEEALGEGVAREWISLVCRALFDPRHGLFSPCPRDQQRFFLNPASGADPLQLKYFDFAGRMIGLALMHNVPVGVRFDRTLFFQLAGRPLTLDDIADADPSTHASCKKILEMDPDLVDSDALGLTFAREVGVFGSGEVIELLPGGRDIAVDSKNRGQYIELLIQSLFMASTKDQLTHFAKGFSYMLVKPELRKLFFLSLHLKDLDSMLGGRIGAIDVQEWKEYTRYEGGFTQQDDQINWFWEAVASMMVEEQRRLLFFWTSVEYLPFDGFRGLHLGSGLVISKASLKTSEHLPSSSTCFYRLNMPVYTSFSMTLSRLQKITQEHVSNSFGEI